jgi:hypothetical protein
MSVKTWATGEQILASDLNGVSYSNVPIGGIVAWLKTFAQRSTGTNTTASANKLINASATFVTDAVLAGEVVENYTDGTFAYVVSRDSQTQLTLSADIFTGTGKTYYVWKTQKLEANYAECNGQSLSDAGSPYNGVTLPNLNGSGGGTQRFLRGKTRSGATGGEDTHALTIPELAAHTHSSLVSTGQSVLTGGAGVGESTSGNTGSTGSGTAHENKPSYYEIVWVMRVK